jgi:hypothetical protein
LPSRFARRLLRGESMSMKSLSIIGDVSVAFVADSSCAALIVSAETGAY